MIFVLLGIIVLVASFLIALVSLVKDQGKASDEKADGKAGGQGVFPKASQAKSLIAQKPVAKVQKPVVARELFPWEEGKYQEANTSIEADRAKLEELRKQLAELKSLAGEVQAVREPEKITTEQTPQPTKPLKQGKELRGEISISDLKRQ